VLSDSAVRGPRDAAASPPSSGAGHSKDSDRGGNKHETPSNKAALTLRLFDLVSGQSEVDHPVCAECADALLELMQSRMEQVKNERDAYLTFERDMIASAKTGAQPSKDELRREITQVC
jgi:beclin